MLDIDHTFELCVAEPIPMTQRGEHRIGFLGGGAMGQVRAQTCIYTESSLPLPPVLGGGAMGQVRAQACIYTDSRIRRH